MQFRSYVSTPRILPGEGKDEIARILAIAQARNKKMRVTGVLFLDERNFFQTIEGPHDAVRTMFQSSARDSRHVNVRVLVDEPVEERRFSTWSMLGFHDVSSLAPNRSIIQRMQDRFFAPSAFNAVGVAPFAWTLVADMADHRVFVS